MAAQETSGEFLDTPIARVLALIIAVAMGALLWMNYSSDFKQLLASESASETQMVSVNEPAKPVNVELQQCLDKRIGDVDQMKKDGILSEAQYSAFRERAEQLCRQQNPGG